MNPTPPRPQTHTRSRYRELPRTTGKQWYGGMTNKYVKNAREGAKGTKTQTHTKPQDARRRRRDKRKSWYATPPPPHPQTNTRFLNRGRQQEAAQGTTSMLNKKKHETAFHAHSIGETQCGEVCYRRRSEKKKNEGGDTNHNTQKKKKKRTCARSFSTGEENMMGRKDRYVLRITHATHLC